MVLGIGVIVGIVVVFSGRISKPLTWAVIIGIYGFLPVMLRGYMESEVTFGWLIVAISLFLKAIQLRRGLVAVILSPLITSLVTATILLFVSQPSEETILLLLAIPAGATPISWAAAGMIETEK